ncbi:MAG: amino acid ABC transporter permease, partial [Prevotella sp.]|nr:amino acid ABC transporter permease [Prevotella sp.]MDY6027800.1 amino acid ABC transporter permease [Prevotella sp.]
MKEQHAIYTLLLLLSVLCSCNGGKYPRYLLEADSLCMTNPDSALTLLKGKEKAVKAESEAS